MSCPRFFLYIYIASFVLIGGYFFCSFYNFLWIICPSVGKLSKFLYGCQRQNDSYTAKVITTSDRPVIRLKLYFKVRKLHCSRLHI